MEQGLGGGWDFGDEGLEVGGKGLWMGLGSWDGGDGGFWMGWSGGMDGWMDVWSMYGARGGEGRGRAE